MDKKITKICSKCNLEKELSEFHKDKTTKSGLKFKCKECTSLDNKKHREKNQDLYVEYRKVNRDKLLENNKRYSDKNKEKIALKTKEAKKNNPERFKAINKKYYENNKEAIQERTKEYNVKYREENKDKINKKNKAYYAKNKEAENKRSREWKKTDIGLISTRQSKLNRKDRLKNGIITREETKELISKIDSCYWCNKKIDKKDTRSFHLDHYKPLAKGGLNIIENIVVSCAFCNMSKGAKEPELFANSIGKLL